LALVGVWIIFTIVTDGVFLEPRNFSNLMRQTAVTGILAVGMVMVILAGQIDLSVGSLWESLGRRFRQTSALGIAVTLFAGRGGSGSARCRVH
jgi:ABC-type xylose transport system permease subunit